MNDDTKPIGVAVYDHDLDQNGFSLARLDEARCIVDFDDLCAALKVVGIDGFENWLEGVHDENDWVSAQTDVTEDDLLTYIHQSPLQDVHFSLQFPCTLDAVAVAVAEMEQTVARHQLVMYTPVDVFGLAGEDHDDDIATLAKILCVTEEALADVVGGPGPPTKTGLCGTTTAT